MGLSCTRTSIHIYDVRGAENSFSLLFIQSAQVGCLDLLLIVHIFVLDLIEEAPFRSWYDGRGLLPFI